MAWLPNSGTSPLCWELLFYQTHTYGPLITKNSFGLKYNRGFPLLPRIYIKIFKFNFPSKIFIKKGKNIYNKNTLICDGNWKSGGIWNKKPKFIPFEEVGGGGGGQTLWYDLRGCSPDPRDQIASYCIETAPKIRYFWGFERLKEIFREKWHYDGVRRNIGGHITGHHPQ